MGASTKFAQNFQHNNAYRAMVQSACSRPSSHRPKWEGIVYFGRDSALGCHNFHFNRKVKLQTNFQPRSGIVIDLTNASEFTSENSSLLPCKQKSSAQWYVCFVCSLRLREEKLYCTSLLILFFSAATYNSISITIFLKGL